MSKLSIRVEHLGKQYHIGRRIDTKRTLREAVVDRVAAPFRRAGNLFRGQAPGGSGLDETIWALRDISFEIQRGEAVGIIGRNGAGKSTLLKVLSRITEPTEGMATIYGRVGSLLEVGTGFNLELTGRENIYLNGAILGMQRSEIARKFDEIVSFAEVEKFIDTPVKHYSSGMRLRLGFAVAAHLEPEILLVDEVLAVGDARFQKRCLNKMEDVGQQGRAVLFVSHSMPAITRLCQRAILLDGGRLIEDGPASQVVGTYLNSGLGTSAAREWPELDKAPGDDVIRLCAVRVRAEDGNISDVVDIRRPVALEMEYQVLKPDQKFMIYFRVLNEEGVEVFISIDNDPAWRMRPRSVGRYTSKAWIPGNFLAEGTLFVGAAARTLEPMVRRFHSYDAVAFQVIDSMEGDSARVDHGGRLRGVVRPLLKWETRLNSDEEKTPAATEQANEPLSAIDLCLPS
jgi:lipopolysaccharide transport system ATP-binding protein